MTQRMFWKKVKKCLNELNFLVMRLTELNFFSYDSKNWTFFFEKINDSKNTPFFFKKRWFQELFFFSILLTELIEHFSTWLIEIEHFFLNVTQRIFFYKNFDSQKWLIFSGKMTQRIELFVNDSLNWASYEPLLNKSWTFVLIWLKELNFLWM